MGFLQRTHQCTKDSVQGGSQSHPSGCTLEVGRGQRHPADAVPDHCSMLDYGCIVYGTASHTNLRQLDSIHNAGLRLALGAFCTSPVSSMYTEANEAPLEERRLKLSMNYYMKTRACTDNPAHHALHEFDPTTRDLYLPRPNGKGGMTRPPAKPIGLKVEEAMISAEIDIETVCPLGTPTFPPGTHEYDPKRHSLIEGVSKCMITREEAQAKFREYCDAQGPHDEVYTDGSKIDEGVGAAAVINRHFRNGETTCRQLSKRLRNKGIIFAAEATAITLALNYYRHMDPVQHDVVIYSDSMSCLQVIEGEDTNNPLICQIMNLLWALSDKGTCVRFCWVPSHCGIEENEIVDQLVKETLDHDIDPLTTVHFADLKPLVNSYIQQEVQIKWDVSIHGRDLYLLKPTLGPPKRFRHLTRAEEVVITRLRIGHTKATKSHIPYPEDHQLLVSIVARLWQLSTYSLNVQCCNKVVMSTTQLTHWGPSLRRPRKLA